ncbi:hypothetical protein [Streptomyces hirsutus]|uniref:hypothetical protein n=1 Tax=Streptomyces hirsutus TaxID=35620 RepID=UPI001B80ACCB|nr:hypothetical protein [Streptomyces hirsutus]
MAPTVPGATPGTVIGAAEVLDHRNRRLERVPLRAEMPTQVEIPHEERCLVHGWSPYLSVQTVVVSGGRTQQAVLSPRRTNRESTGREESRRGATGWVRLWNREQDGEWTVRNPADMATGKVATVATPSGNPTVLQVGGGHRHPVCTLVPEGSLFTLHPTEHQPQGPVKVRPLADSGFTLLEALRLGEWGWAAVVEQVWWDDPSVRGIPLFDLAVAYLACRRGDLERAGRWRQETGDRHQTGPAGIDVLAVDAWLARRRGEWRELAGILAQLAEAGEAPLAAEGLDLLAAELTRPAPNLRTPQPGGPLRRHLTPYLRASLPSSLSSFTAAHPQQPEPRAPKRVGVGEPLAFKVERDESVLRILWRQLSSSASTGREAYAPAAERALDPREPRLMPSEPEERRDLLIVEDEDPMVLWRLSRRLLDEGVATEISIVPGRDAIAVVLPGLRMGSVAALLAGLLRQGLAQRLELNVGGARQHLDVVDTAEAERILAVLLRESHRSSP